MHHEAFQHMKTAYQRHVAPLGAGEILEVGSKSRKAEYRHFFEGHGWRYTGADLQEGPNVTTVLDDPFRFPFADSQFDAIISGQMLEHNAMFWLTFMEMARVLRMGGVMVHIAPSRGPEHRAPQDCWRFYRRRHGRFGGLVRHGDPACLDRLVIGGPGAQGKSKPRTARRMKREARFLDTDWGDTIGVFRKTTETAHSTGAGYIRQFAAQYESAIQTGGENALRSAA